MDEEIKQMIKSDQKSDLVFINQIKELLEIKIRYMEIVISNLENENAKLRLKKGGYEL